MYDQLSNPTRGVFMLDDRTGFPERIIFHVDVLDDHPVSKKTILKQIHDFIKKSEKQNEQSNYGIVLFNEEDNNPAFLEELSHDEHEFDKILKGNVKTCCGSHPFEHGIMIALYYLIESFKVDGKNILRVIAVSDGRSTENAILTKALIDLLENVKYMPVHIDVVMIGKEEDVNPHDQRRFKFITLTTGGRLLYAADTDALKDQFEILLDTPPVPGILDESVGTLPPSKIPESYKSYFEAISWSLISSSGKPEKGCVVCNKIDGDNTIFGCERCGAIYHQSCAFGYAEGHNIGFIHIFRCASCASLLSLDETKIRANFGLPVPEPVKE
nr:hypothetical protein [Candidatus Sigynarchaeota archaeon]